MSDELVPSSSLAEPVWAGILRWYLPFVVVFFAIYVPLVILVRAYIALAIDCRILDTCASTVDSSVSAFRYSLHSIIDVPLPVGLMHAYMTAL